MAITPAYLALLYTSATLVSGNIPVIRAFSVVPGLISILLLYGLGCRLGGRRAGLIAALCLALSPQHIWHNQEIRPYSLLFMCCLMALWGLLKWRDNGFRRWFFLNYVFNGLLIFTHLFGVLFLLPQGLYLLGRKEYKVFVRWAAAQTVFVALLLIAILVKPHLSEAYHPDLGLSPFLLVARLFPALLLRSFCADVLRWHTGIWPWFESGTSPAVPSWLTAILGMRTFFDLALTLLILVCIALFALMGSRLRQKKSGSHEESSADKRAEWVLLLSIIFIPSVILATLTLLTSANFSDYGHDIYATIGIYTIIGLVLSRLPGRYFRITIGILVLLYGYQCLLFLPGATRSDWRSGAAYIREDAAPEDLVLDLWWNGPISRREPYFSDVPQTFQRVNTLLAVAEEAEDFFDAHVKLEEEENASPSVWLLAETRFWREWFPDHDFMPLLTEVLDAKGLSFSVREFPGGFNLTVVKIYPSPDFPPTSPKDGTSRFWTCDYEQVLYDIGIPQTDSQRKQELLHTLERTIGVWPGVSAMGRMTYPLDLLMTGDLELAEAMAKHIILENPSFGLGYLALAFVRAAQGEPAHAAAAYQSARAHHLGLGYFFDAYFDALCVQKDLDSARAALEQVQRLKIPLFHETAKQVLAITSAAQQRPETRQDETQSPSEVTPPAPSSQRPCVLFEHPATLAGVWEEDASRDVPAVWVDQLFDKQEHAAQLAQWLPFHKQARGIAVKFLFKISGDVESGI
ncbi:MAG TPA: glycosyltransferase family 39 protein, partial [Candidatus Hydrogenedentes bacterium]|nr:glycosyltransferase family 39 protein [Candidatus Hydrogenedentota bacterium]